MKYFFDTEFTEGTQTKRFYGIPYGKTPNTIDLISIGIVSEDNREYYAISKNFNLKEAWNRYQLEYRIVDAGRDKQNVKVYWIRENVLRPIFDEMVYKEINVESAVIPFSFYDFKRLINKYSKTNKQIAFEIMRFTLDPTGEGFDDWLGTTNSYVEALKTSSEEENIEFYAYYCNYDWVVFSWLFGKMIDLPKGFPKYAFDIQQLIVAQKIDKEELKKNVPQIDNHNALSYARWNKDAFDWIMKKIKNEERR